ncbi:MAG: hypothetical protein ACJ72H_15405 [Candidatus Sulfotelmatobacter sp.]
MLQTLGKPAGGFPIDIAARSPPHRELSSLARADDYGTLEKARLQFANSSWVALKAYRSSVCPVIQKRSLGGAILITIIQFDPDAMEACQLRDRTNSFITPARELFLDLLHIITLYYDHLRNNDIGIIQDRKS